MPILYKEDKPRLEQEIKGRGGAREYQLRADIDGFPYEGKEQEQVEYLRTHPVLLRFLQGDEQRGQETERQQAQQQRRPARRQPTPQVSSTPYSEPSFDLTTVEHPLSSVGQWAQDANPQAWQMRSPGGQGPPPSGGMMPGRGPQPMRPPSPRPMLGPQPRPDMGAPPPSGGFTPGQNQDPWLESMRRSRGGRRY